MSLKVITGRAGTGKSHLLMSDMVKKSAENPMGAPLIFLVPEQASFNTEWELLNSYDILGSFRIRVCGFHKLFEMIAEEQDLKLKPWLNDLGKSMILRRLVDKHQGDFSIFAKAARHKGFVENLRLIIDELAKFEISEKALISAGKYFNISGKNPMISEKIADISLVYGEYLQVLNDNYCDETKLLHILATAIENSEFIKESEIYIDGYTDFDPAQIGVLKALIKNAKSVNIALIADDKFEYREESVFAFSEKTFCWLKDFASDNDVVFEHIHLDINHRHFDNVEVKLLEEAFAKKLYGQLGKDIENQTVTIVSAENTEKQIEYIASVILNKVKNNDYRMSDFAIISRDLATSNNIICEVLDKFEIPHFADTTKNMYHHPLVETVLALLEVMAEKWQSVAVLRFLKTGMISVSNEDLWRLENYALANGIKGSYWKKAGNWERFYQDNRNLMKSDDEEELSIAQSSLAEINEIGKNAVAPLQRFESALKQLEKVDGKYLLNDIINLITDFFDYIGIEEIMGNWWEKAVLEKDSDKAVIHKQILPAFNGLLKQLQDFLGDTYVSLTEVYELIAEGSSEMDLAIIPPSVDEVMVSDVSRSRIYNIKCAFVIDCNEGVFPMRVSDDGLFSTQERDELRSVGLNLAVSKKELQFAEDYQIYIALTRAKNELYICKSEFDLSGNPLNASVIVENIKMVLPNVGCITYDEKLSLNEVFNNRAILEKAERRIADLDNSEDNDLWWQIIKYFKTENEFDLELNSVASGYEYKKDTGLLSTDVVEKIYGKMKSTSVSRIETFNRCPCMYFSRYGLKLDKREEFTMDSRNVGLIYHDILANVLEKIIAESFDLAAINADNIRPMVESAIDNYTAKGTESIFEQNEKNKYMRDKIIQVVLNCLLDISNHLSMGDFRPVGFEVAFGNKMEIEAVKFELSNGNVVTLNGVIDRVDMAETETDTYYRIIDYKSSNKELELRDIYYGLNWQMPVYLDAFLNSKSNSDKQVKPAGMFYFAVKDLVESVENSKDKAEKKSLKMKGLAILDSTAVELAENNIWHDLKCKSMNVTVNKNGSFSKSSKGFEPNDFPIIQKYIKLMITDNLERMVKGEVGKTPVINNGKMNCEFCDFINLCLLDNSIKNNGRVLHKLNSTDALYKIKDYVYQNDEVNDSE